MFGKYKQTINTTLDSNSVYDVIRYWASEHKLSEVKSSEYVMLYRFGQPFLFNPIYIQLDLKGHQLNLSGWVQTIIPVLRWQLLPGSKKGWGTTIDLRRKGGLFCKQLIELLS